LDFFDTKKVVTGCKKQAPAMDDEEDEGVEAPGWVGASFGVFFLSEIKMTDMRRKNMLIHKPGETHIL